MRTPTERLHGRRSNLLIGALAILLAPLPTARGASAVCPSAITGPDTSLANDFAEYAIWHPIYQTFVAADEQLEAVTVWRLAADSEFVSGILVSLVTADGTGTPLPAPILQNANGPDPSPSGDGIHPTPIRVVFSPPVPLSTGTRYALAFHLIHCSSLESYALQAISGSAADPALGAWQDVGRRPDCSLQQTPELLAGIEIIQRLEFCSASTPALPTSWGRLKSHYR